MYWYKRDPNAALTGMAELNLEQRGLYNSLLDLLYSQDGAVPDDDHVVARRVTTDIRQYRRLKAQLIAAGKLSIVDGHLQCPRLEATLKEAHRLSVQQARIAKKRDAQLQDFWRTSAGDLPEVSENSEPFFNDFNAPCEPTDQEDRYSEYPSSFPPPQSKKENGPVKNGEKNGAAQPAAKPRHGQRSPRGRIWFDRDTLEFEAHADDYRNAHHGLDPPMQWDKTGAWFEIVGEPSH